ncbi:hypothetical protein Tco_0012335 [Tanacetum coccineum]
MKTKDTLSSCSDLDEQEIQQLQKQAKILKDNSLNKLNALKTTIQHLSSSNSLMYYTFKDAFQLTLEADERTFKKPKQVKDSMYHKEKMLLCKQAEKGVQLQAEQSDWLADTDEEIDEQELEAHYSYMAKIQEVPNADSGTDAEPLEHVQYDTDDNVFANDIQHFEQSESITNAW